MKRTLAYLLAFVPLLVLTVPGTASAAFWGPIIDGRCICPGSAPDWGCVIQTVQNTMNLAVSLAVVIATLVIAYAGAIWLVSPVNPKSREMGRTMLLNAVIGLVVLLAGWIFVDFLMKQLYNENANSNGVQLGPWNEILKPSATGDDMCITRRTEFGAEGTPSTGGTGTVTTPAGGDDDDDEDTATPEGTLTHSCTGTTQSGDHDNTPKQSLSCANCTRITGVPCKSASSCRVTASLATKLANIDFDNWRVTEAFQPTICSHSNSCHYDGTCVDAGFTGTPYTATAVKSFMQAAAAAGTNPYFETDDCNLRDEVRALGMSKAYCSSDQGYGGLTGTHFSLYGP